MEDKIEFREVPGFDGKYMAGSDGIVYFTERKKNKPYPCPLKGVENPNGYLYCCLRLNGKAFLRLVHIWICLSFHGEKPTPKHVVRHLDGNKRNNKPENLCWGTSKENSEDTLRHGNTLKGSKNPQSKFTAEEIMEIREIFSRGEIGITDLSRFYKVSHGQISRIIGRKRWGHI